MDEALFQRVKRALERSWSAESSVCFSPAAHPSYGQCAQTAIVVCETFGGKILRTTGWHGSGNHFYNCIDGMRVDFTAGQFSMADYSYALTYEDHPSNVQEAEDETVPGQVEALRFSFRRAFDEAA